jgi:hypothetical protein
MITLSTKDFTYNPDSKHFAGEASATGAPERFALQSQWTGKEIVFAQRDVLMDRSGCATVWIYTPEDTAYAALSLTIYND